MESEDLTLDDEEETGPVSSAELILMLQNIWLNEKFAPEILPNRYEVVECVLGQLSYMEQNIATIPSSDFKRGIHQLEVDRIRFLLSSYLRQRLEKIETYVLHILKQEEGRQERGEDLYLTEAELQFAKTYRDDFSRHMEQATNFYPDLPVDGWRTQLVAPNTNSFVFAKTRTHLEGVNIEPTSDGDVVDLNPDAQILISYNCIKDLVMNNNVQLI